MSPRSISRVAIVGRDIDLWLTACVLRRALAPSGLEVVAIELPSMLEPADFHATQPALEALHNQIGIDEAALLRVAGGAYTLGQNFTRPDGDAVPFLVAHGAYGTSIDGHDFFPYWLKARRFGLNVALEEFSPTAVAARNGRLLVRDDATDAFGRSDYGYHLPASGHAAVLRHAAIQLGVRVIDGAEIDIEAGDGEVHAIIAGSNRVTADLFIDASGADAELIGAIGDDDSVDWTDQFPGDRILTALAPRMGPVPLYAEIRAGTGGWTGLYPASIGTFVRYVFSRAETRDEDAVQAASAAAGMPLSHISFLTLRPARRSAAWCSNCIAVGPAAARFDPVHDVDLHTLQQGLVRLLACFPATSDFAAHRAEYNRAIASTFDCIRDFQAAHYRLARYAGPFWDRARATSMTPDLAHRIATFRARGEIAPWEDESFPADSWRALLVGHGVTSDSWSPVIDNTPPDEMRAAFRTMLGFVREQVLRQPVHDDQLARIMRRASP